MCVCVCMCVGVCIYALSTFHQYLTIFPLYMYCNKLNKIYSNELLFGGGGKLVTSKNMVFTSGLKSKLNFLTVKLLKLFNCKTIKTIKTRSSVCTYGAWKLSSPDSFGGGGREVPLAHIISRAAQHRSVWKILFFKRKDRNFYSIKLEGERIHEPSYFSWTVFTF